MKNDKQQNEEKKPYVVRDDQKKANTVVILAAALDDMKSYQSNAGTYQKIQNIITNIQNGIMLPRSVLSSVFVSIGKQWRVGNEALFVSFIPYGTVKGKPAFCILALTDQIDAYKKAQAKVDQRLKLAQSLKEHDKDLMDTATNNAQCSDKKSNKNDNGHRVNFKHCSGKQNAPHAVSKHKQGGNVAEQRQNNG